ncbi:putative pyridoxal kinase Bud17p [Diutina catenulata]
MPSLLSVSSHVTHGYVGNKAMIFPLQYCGWDADAINTTNYSNHPGHGKFAGSVASAAEVADILDGLHKILDFAGYDLIVTGYTPSAEVLEVLLRQMTALPTPVPWVVDPVLGDNGRLYVSAELIPVYQRFMASGLVTLTTPNQFEFETLVGSKVTDFASLKQAIAAFYAQFRVQYLVVSSVVIDGTMYSIGSDGTSSFAVPIEEVPCRFSGSGDLFCALLANAFHRAGRQLGPEILADTVGKLTTVLKMSLARAQQTDPEVAYVRDLDIVGAREVYLQPVAANGVDVAYL